MSTKAADGVKSLTGAGRNSPTTTERRGPRRFWALGAAASTRRTAEPRTPTSDGATPSTFGDDTPPRGVADREPRRDGVARPDVDDDDDDDDDESSTELAVEPSDPVLSANADGSATTAEPIPKATASAPTRPTYDAITEEGPVARGRAVADIVAPQGGNAGDGEGNLKCELSDRDMTGPSTTE